MSKYQDILKGGDLRSIGEANEIVAMVNNQTAFDELFEGLTYPDRKVVMRSADAIEKITLRKSDYLQKHKMELLNLCQSAKDIELKWHLALLISRVGWTNKELGRIWQILTAWATDTQESKIVRVNSVQGLFNLLKQQPELFQDFNLTLARIEKERIPSIDARIKKLKNASR
jgi:hypothetical protein